ncbi:MAG: ROK family protein [Acidobacteria bacterium]|nr:ROK family protein [Acidobacteriota bacterium]NIM63345.1 ROK family protein [Acidobacteriota bacterium]NIO60084.1 ROK family protein [Acidobacteriota bacterium]NIQ86777.1 ROK family protein [Acidobacteriota bacterium]NIT12116.1 ROK family protein [Acidobacteriota bacterium]
MKVPKNQTDSRPSRILAGDIGGTYSRLAIFSQQADGYELERLETYLSPEHNGLAEVLASFFEEGREEVDAACFGLPAPIRAGEVLPLTNLSWLIDLEKVLREIGTDRVALINDAEATAVGIEELSESDLICLQPGQADPAGNRVVVTVGTGLGVSALSPAGLTLATEAGHTTFSPRTKFDFELYASLHSMHGHVSWERVASGMALPVIHALLSPGQSLDAADIVRRAPSDDLCARAVEILRGYIGAAAGNVALTLMASGGLYLAGGVAGRVLGREKADRFLSAFCDKGRMRGLLECMPVFLVKSGNLALRGAAKTAVDRFST